MATVNVDVAYQKTISFRWLNMFCIYSIELKINNLSIE